MAGKIIDLTGKTFGNLTIIKELGHNRVLCRCNLCGTVKEINKQAVKSGKVISCGCWRRDLTLNKKKAGVKPKYSYHVGDKKNKLTILEILPGGLLKCRCDCGNITTVIKSQWASGYTKSCGCLYKERKTYDKGTSISQINKDMPNKNNKLSIRGVSLQDGKYIAQAMFRRKKYYLGMYNSLEDAATIYNIFKEEAKNFFKKDNVKEFDRNISKIIAKYKKRHGVTKL